MKNTIRRGTRPCFLSFFFFFSHRTAACLSIRTSFVLLAMWPGALHLFSQGGEVEAPQSAARPDVAAHARPHLRVMGPAPPDFRLPTGLLSMEICTERCTKGGVGDSAPGFAVAPTACARRSSPRCPSLSVRRCWRRHVLKPIKVWLGAADVSVGTVGATIAESERCRLLEAPRYLTRRALRLSGGRSRSLCAFVGRGGSHGERTGLRKQSAARCERGVVYPAPWPK